MSSWTRGFESHSRRYIRGFIQNIFIYCAQIVFERRYFMLAQNSNDQQQQASIGSNEKEEEQEYQELEQIKNELKEQIREELQKQNKEEQQILSNKENIKNVIDFIVDNKDSIKVEDLKISEPFYKCYREKGNCIICNSLSNIICTNCCNNHKEIWLCTNHWQQHKIEKHE